MSKLSGLSENDRSVLNAIFSNGEIHGSSHQSNEIEYDDELPDQLTDIIEADSPALRASLQLEADAVQMAENSNFDLAIEQLQNAIKLTPNRASLYNNRAQVYRLVGNDEDAMGDLCEALRLSNGTGRAGCKAFCQRGMLKRKMGDIDAAKDDFSKAATLGSKFARTQLITLNPYAALCNQMLAQAFEKLT